MKTKSVTFTLGTSSHFFKSSVSLTIEGGSKEDIENAKNKLKKMYFDVLRMEVGLSKKFDKMSFEEIEKYLKTKE